MKNNFRKKFYTLLKKYKRARRTGQGLSVLMRSAAYFLAGLMLYSLLDFFLAFSPSARMRLNGVFIAALAVYLVWHLVQILKISDKDTAETADRELGRSRQEILTALELNSASSHPQKNQADETGPDAADSRLSPNTHQAGLGSYLAGICTEKASKLLKGANFRQRYPVEALGRSFRFLSIALLAAGLVFALNISGGITILSRIAMPAKDIPPYSRFQFEISPGHPSVLYGGDAEISVKITGAPVRSQVWFVTRNKNKMLKTPCFQLNGAKYAQRLEKMIHPVEFCFRTGRARSRWQKVSLMLQPRIEQVRTRLIPPPYSGLPERSFRIGDDVFESLRGTETRLFVTSNRPLSAGSMIFRPRSNGDNETAVKGEIRDRHTAVFKWVMTENGTLSVTLLDERGIESREPYTIHQRVVEDRPPRIDIAEPGGFVMATPDAVIPVRVRGEDDLAIRHVDMVRTVVGYRDRIKPVAPEYPVNRYTYSGELDLGAAGVEPGQMLEFFFEAADGNPDMTGIAASGISRIEIVSKEAYAEGIRAREGLEAFVRRFRVIADEMPALAGSADALEKMLADGRASKAEIKAALDQLREKNRRALEVYSRLADDFPVYDVEKQLVPHLQEAVKALKKHKEMLAAASENDPGLAALVEDIVESIGEKQETIREPVADAEEIAKTGRIMQCAARFKRIHERQSMIARRLGLYANRHAAKGSLDVIKAEQAANREALMKLLEDMAERAAALPQKEEYGELRKTTLSFADRVATYEIPKLMAEAAGAYEAESALNRAELALERMTKLLSDCGGDSGFGGYANRRNFSVPRGGRIQATLNQLFEAMLGGSGASGPESGFSMDGGASPLNVPVYGPGRTDLSEQERTGGKKTAAASGKAADFERQEVDVPEKSERKGRNVDLDMVPEKYREALKVYFEYGD